MGVDNVEALVLARRIAMFNGEAIHYVKNSLLKMTASILKKLRDRREKFIILIKTNFPKANPELILATVQNNKNHDLLKLDVDLIYDVLVEDTDEFSD